MTNINESRVAKWRCENEFLFFIRYFFKQRFGSKFIVSDHHVRICDALEKVYRGETKRLVINIPPRYGKTEIAVINFIAWCIAKNPKSKFIHLSYSDDLVLDNSAQIKELVLSDWYQEFWRVGLKSDSQSKKKWYTQSGGGVYATSAGGAVTGFGAGSTSATSFEGAIIIDDPLKPDDAQSETLRSAVNRRLNTTIKSRLNHRDTPMIVIMQRIHDDDMSGFILDDGTGETWELLKLPAINQDKTPLWPYKHTIDELEVIKKADRYSFSGQYMQEPIPDEGIYFSKDSFRWYDEAPAHLNYYTASDYAVTEGGGDYTEHGVFGICPDGNIYIVDWWSGQTKADVWIEQLIDLFQKYKPLKAVGETGPIKAAVEPWLIKRMRERKSYAVLEWMSHSKNNKEANARSFQALTEAGRVYLPKNKQWALELELQLSRFPMSKYDDKVDVCSLFARMISEIWGATTPPSENAKQIDDYKFNDDDDEDNQSWQMA